MVMGRPGLLHALLNSPMALRFQRPIVFRPK